MFVKLGLVCILVAGASAAYSSSGAGAGTWNGYNNYGAKYPYQQAQTQQYGYTQQQPGYGGGGGGGGYVSTGTGGAGFSGTQVGFNNGFPFAPLPGVPPIPTPYDYNQYVNQFLGGFASGPGGAGSSYAYSTPEATASAKTNLESNDLYNQQQQFFNNLQHQFGAHAGSAGGGYAGGNGGGFAGGSGGGYAGGNGGGYAGAGHGQSQGGYGGGYNGYAPNFAAASGTYGPGGVHQTATIYPSNPGSPNVDTRFGEDGSSVSVTSGQPGFVGVSTASFSSSSDVNGEKQNHREAVTSVNENGKVTTYRVRS